MVFLPRLPVSEDSMRKHEASSGTAEAGSIMYLTASGTVAKVTASGHAPYGILFHRVKAPLPGLPQNFEFPGEIGSADARLGDPVLLYVEGGLFESDHYDYSGSSGLPVGTKLYARVNDSDDNGKLTNDTSNVALKDGSPKVCAEVVEPLTHAECQAKKRVTLKLHL